MSTTQEFNASIYMNRAFEKAASSAATDFATAAVHHLALTYGFDASEAITKLGLDSVTVKKSAGRKKGEGKAKSPKMKLPKRLVPTIPLPWCGETNTEWCSGLRLNHGLHSQCTNAKQEGEYCITCHRQADKNSSAKPTYGTTNDRLNVGVLEFRCPKSGKQTLPYANVMKKLGITRAKVEEEAIRFNMTIPEAHFVERMTPRGRPKKDSSASDTDSPSSSPKKRGRPTKEKKLIASSVGDDLIASLVANSSKSTASKPTLKVTTTDIVSSPSKSPENKAARKAAQEAKVVELRSEWIVLANTRQGNPIPDDQGNMSVMTESEIATAAAAMTKIGILQKALVSMRKVIKADQKEAKRLAAELIADNSTQSELAVEEMNPEEEKEEVVPKYGAYLTENTTVEPKVQQSNEEQEEQEEPEVEVVRFEHDGVNYLKTADQMLYLEADQSPAGMWNPESKTVTPLGDDSDEDSSDDEDDA
jgi:hypothetical protein